MEKGIQTRYIIYQILKIIKMGSLNFDDAYEKKAKKYYLSVCDRKFIQNVVLNSMRNYIYIDLIIKKFSR